MVWDPPDYKNNSKPKKIKRKGSHFHKKNVANKNKTGKRNYDKPWLAPEKTEEVKWKDRKYDSDFLYSIYPDGEGPETEMILGI